MKSSLYNLFFKTDNENEYILFNTLSRAILVVDEELKSYIEKNPNKIPMELRETLRKQWIIIDDDMDELKAISVMRGEHKYHSPYLQFTIINTYNCNLACPYCYQEKRNIYMNEAIAKRIIKFIENFANSYKPDGIIIDILGGEPLLNIDPVIMILDHFLEYCRKHSLKFEVNLTTNGTLINEEIIKKLEKYPMKKIQITLDGPKEVHDRRRIYKNKKGTYDIIINSIKLLKKSKLFPVIRINVDKENKDYIPQLLNDLQKEGLSDVMTYFGIIRQFTRTCSSYEPVLDDRELAKTIPKLWKIAIQKGFKMIYKPQNNLVGCGLQTNSCYVIDALGDVYKCTVLAGEKDKKIGEITNEGKIIFKPFYYEWMARDPLTFSKCRKCPYFPICGGGCALIAYSKYGTYNAPGCFDTVYILESQIKYFLQQKYPDKFLSRLKKEND